MNEKLLMLGENQMDSHASKTWHRNWKETVSVDFDGTVLLFGG